jgi:hypothetical protein
MSDSNVRTNTLYKQKKSEEFMNLRYQGKPLLRLLECYVLHTIGELPDETKAKLENMSFKLSEVYGHSGNWNEIIEKTMSFSEETKEQIIQIWNKNVAIAKDADEYLEPEHFCQLFVDQNFQVGNPK